MEVLDKKIIGLSEVLDNEASYRKECSKPRRKGMSRKDTKKESELRDRLSEAKTEAVNHSDYLERELRRQAQTIEKLTKCVEFYADKAFDNALDFDMPRVREGYMTGEISTNDIEWCGKNGIGGKLARQTLKEIKEP